jgi:HSP20 family protein
MVQRWNPMNEFERMWDEMDRMLSEGFTRARMAPRAFSMRPSFDLFDTGEQLVFKAMLPGARPEDIDLTIEQNTLTIKGRFGHVLSDENAKNATWYRREITAGQFAESFTLPVPVDSEHAEANFQDGILTVTLPKAEQSRVRRISVQSHKAIEGNQSASSQAASGAEGSPNQPDRGAER